jgi:hypothetical protein
VEIDEPSSFETDTLRGRRARGVGAAIAKSEVFRRVGYFCDSDKQRLKRPLLFKSLSICGLALPDPLEVVVSQRVSSNAEVEEVVGFVDW